MKKLILNAVVGATLFAGALIGGLAATGRLNHAGTANIPLLGALFPAPPEPAAAPGDAAGPGTGGAPAGTAVDGTLHGGGGVPADAAAQGEPGADRPRRQKDGRSVVKPDGKAAGGNGEAPAADGQGDAKPAAEQGTPPAPGPETAATGGAPAVPGRAPERDFAKLQESLEGQRKSPYKPGDYFTFQGMPAGLTAEQLNEAWERVRVAQADLEKRKQALDLREQELQTLADDVGKRIRQIAQQRLEIEDLGRKLDERVARFQEQIKLVRTDEVAALRRNAQTLAAFEPSKAAELVTEQWRTDKGQEEVLKTLEFMDKDAVNRILEALPNPMVQDLLEKRKRVSKESAAPAAPRR
ncbi:MAG: hypothetical protein FJ265_11595 [Planctomycetes bacterium]|nr:hypothetical protein [Planctomycetota bacterium]